MTRERRVFHRNMAAMMPSSATASSPYDNDAVERDLIDPDDGASHAAADQVTELTLTSYPR